MRFLSQGIYIYFTLIISGVLLSACASITPKEVAMDKQVIRKSPNDNRLYSTITLGNGLQVMVISDPTTDKAAAALDVDVGSGADPRDRLGLAHFLEHMLFLGTEKYPEPGEYQEFINRNGGNHNAFTAFEHTNYFFDVDADYFEPALDRFSQQFVAPLFSEEYVEREMNAVHSEYTAKIRDDSRRFFAVIKQALNPDHPMAKFAVGNLETLADQPGSPTRKRLIQFYQDFYSAHRMKLVVLGKEPLAQLEQWVREKFSAVARRDVKEIERPRIFREGELPMLVSLQPVKEKRSLTMLFELPSSEPHYRNKPLYYITNLIGHEGEGSLLSWLKEQQLAENLSAGLFTSDHDRSVVSISISLTKLGRQEYLQVMRDTFSYIQLMLQQGIDKWRFDEQAIMMETAFRFQDKVAPIHFVSSLASRLQDHAPEEVLEAPYIMDVFDAQLLRDFSARLTPENMVAVLVAPDVETDQIERWYQAPYAIRSLTPEDVAFISESNTSARIHLPTENQFIPENLDLLALPSMEKPTILEEVSGYTAWYARDVSFGSPKSSFYLSVRSPVANDTAKNLVLAELYVTLAKDALTEFSYPAYLAGLDFKLYKHLRGITVRIDGFSDKQPVLLKEILQTLLNLQIQNDRFDQNKLDYERDLRNAMQNKPFERLAAEARSLLLVPYWTEEEQLEALANVTQDDLRNYIDAFWQATNMVTLNHGNVAESQATVASKVIQEQLLQNTDVIEVNKSQVVNIQPNRWYREIRTEHQDTAYLYYVQGNDKRFEDRAAFGLIAQIMSPEYYHTIRTEAQMGYVVFATPYTLLEVPALAFIVQSPSHTATEIHKATSHFLKSFEQSLAQMPDQEFAKHQEALITRLTEADKTLEQRSDRFWMEIDTQNRRFNTSQEIADEVAKLSKEPLIDIIRKTFVENPESLLLISTPENKPSSKLAKGMSDIEETDEWLEKNRFFPFSP